jgi:release factor glutamine methyltransferase
MDRHYQWPRSYLISHDLDVLSDAFLKDWASLETRRQEGVPIAYLTLTRPFHQIDLIVSPDVLIPRPETELLVERGISTIIDFLHAYPTRFSSSNRLNILDLGCGSGAIILAIAKQFQKAPFFAHLNFMASDVSPSALKIAQQNANNLSLSDCVQFFESNWFDQLPFEQFGIILSNPPYLGANDPHLQMGDLRFEPITALSDGQDGLSCLRAIIAGAPLFLRPQGFIAVEHGYDQLNSVLEMMAQAGLQEMKSYTDLAGIPRVVSARKAIAE